MRVAFAGSNDQPYRSVNQWLLEEGVSKINPWLDATKAWARENPQRLRELLWSNPRYIFFREDALSDFDAGFGPRAWRSRRAARSQSIPPAFPMARRAVGIGAVAVSLRRRDGIHGQVCRLGLKPCAS